MEMTPVSRALKQLREEGLAELAVSESRRKGRIYRLTETGEQVVAIAGEME